VTVARSFRSPTIEERYLYADLGGKLTVGNPNINSEYGTFAEGGFTFIRGPMKLSGQTYINSINDMIYENPNGEFNGRPAIVYTNAGKALVYGFEALAERVVRQNLLFSADFSTIQGTDTKNNTYLPLIPPSKAHIRARWITGNGFWLESLLTFVDRQDKVAPGEEKTPGYGIFTLTAGKTLVTKSSMKHELVIGVKNLGDKLYRDHLTISRGYEMYGLGRSFFVSLNVSID
jgi:outer membrane receptor protein involved in Fe transport